MNNYEQSLKAMMNRLKILGFVALAALLLVAVNAREEEGPCEEDDFDIESAQINYGKSIFNLFYPNRIKPCTLNP